MTTALHAPPVATDIGPPPHVRLPDFIILGSAKCGTTTLYEYLRRHPQLHMSPHKEPEFFADKFDLGWEWYGALFAEAGPDQLCGEASTIYTWWQEYPTCAARLGRWVPQAKLIYLMRHPVQRTYSDYGEQIKTARALNRLGPHLATFENYLEAYPHLVQAGEYIRYIEEYRRHFPAEAFLFLLLEDLQRDPGAVLRQVCRHLGIDAGVDLLSAGPVHANEARAYQQWQLRLHMTQVLRGIPGFEHLSSLVPQRLKDCTYHLLERTRRAAGLRARLAPPPMQPATRARLVARFRESNRRLAALLGRDLSHWDQ